MAEEHGCIAVPVDIDPYTLTPSIDAVKSAITDKSKVMIFAFVYGVTYDIEPYANLLKEHKIEIIEDCAQSFRSLSAFSGSRHATLTMFSFGNIKFCTAFNGAVTIVRDSYAFGESSKVLHEDLNNIQSNYKSQLTNKDYLAKIRKVWALKNVLHRYMGVKALLTYCKFTS